MAKARKYYTLCLRDDGPNVFAPEFGDYDYATVKAEMDSYTEHAYLKRNARIVISNDDQASINAAVAELNK
jgi:hypothetical protein